MPDERRDHAATGDGCQHGFVLDAVRALWPPPATISVSRPTARRGWSRQADRTLIAVPNLSSARMLLPTKRRLAADCLQRARRPLTSRDALLAKAAGIYLHCGGGSLTSDRIVIGHGRGEGLDTVETYLSSVMGRPLTVAVFLGPPRANRKPILQLIDVQGEVLAIAKVGVNELTNRLVRSEAEHLSLVSGRIGPEVVVPELIHHAQWRGMEVLVQSYLPVHGATRRDNVPAREAAIAAIAGCLGRREVPLRTSTYVGRLRERLASSPSDSVRDLCMASLEGLQARAAEQLLPIGSWHGDLTAWNMVTDRGRALVWDWERFESGVPVGFDALHFEFVKAVTNPRLTSSAAVQLLASADRILQPFGVPGRLAADIALLYLVELALRYRLDGQAATGVVGGDVASWLLPVVAAAAGHDMSGGRRGVRHG